MAAPYTEVISYGGCNEDDIGGNCTIVTYHTGKTSYSIRVDCGNKFARGKDNYYEQFFPLVPKQVNELGIFVTHAHFDHNYAIPHLLNYGVALPDAMYGSAMTMHMTGFPMRYTLGPDKAKKIMRRQILAPRQVINLGPFQIEMDSVSHSVSGARSVYVVTPTARLVFSGDFKMDQKVPVGPATDIARFEQIGQRGVDGHYIESTRCQVPGFTAPEQEVRDLIREQVLANPDVVEFILPLMSSSIQRMAMVAEVSQELGIPIVYKSRSMNDTLTSGKWSGDDLEKQYPGARIFTSKSEAGRQILCSKQKRFFMGSGSQAERNAFFTKVTDGSEQAVILSPKESMVLYLASVIPGNEDKCEPMFETLDQEQVRYIKCHVSGHGCAGDLLRMSELTAPMVVFPVHGSREHMAHHAMIQREAGHNVQEIRNGQRWRYSGYGQMPYYAGEVELRYLACKELESLRKTDPDTGKEFFQNVYEYAEVDTWDAPKTESGIILQKPKRIISQGCQMKLEPK